MDRLRSIRQQLTGLSVLNLLVLDPLQKLLSRTLNLIPLAELNVLAVVLDLYMLLESDILVQFKKDATAKLDVLYAV